MGSRNKCKQWKGFTKSTKGTKGAPEGTFRVVKVLTLAGSSNDGGFPTHCAGEGGSAVQVRESVTCGERKQIPEARLQSIRTHCVMAVTQLLFLFLSLFFFFGFQYRKYRWLTGRIFHVLVLPGAAVAVKRGSCREWRWRWRSEGRVLVLGGQRCGSA